jgi:D-glycero-D-manno-heptose 1,7-bisphosphate phosphatase
MNKAVFLDRDGTIIEEGDYLHRPEDVVLLVGAGEGLRVLREAGFLLFVVSNQSGVGRGYFTMADVEKVNERVVRDLEPWKVRFDKVYIAPEAPNQPSRGRKPLPQFLLDARDEFNLDLGRSYIIGDKLIDLECGWNAGVRRSILVRTGYGAETEKKAPGKLGSAIVCDDLGQAADWIVRDAGVTYL